MNFFKNTLNRFQKLPQFQYELPKRKALRVTVCRRISNRYGTNI